MNIQSFAQPGHHKQPVRQMEWQLDNIMFSVTHLHLYRIISQEPPKSKKVQHSNAKNAVLFEAIYLIIHMDSDPNLLVRACNQLGHFLQHRETNLR